MDYRVSYVRYYENFDPLQPDDYNIATYYSYDIHGNVKEMWNEMPTLAATDLHYTHLQYSYDLISGKVKEVVYQPGRSDEFHHRYDYDAANRITDVWTSRNGLKWERDAEYYYYLHGPLARMELGDNKVQGLDYAYTLQGWLKAVNRDLAGKSEDIGVDGTEYSTQDPNQHSAVAEDAFGFSLGYFEGDYSAGNESFLASIDETAFSTTSPDLFNGNIKRMITMMPEGIGNVYTPRMYSYKYDQLNRIMGMQSYTAESGGSWGSTCGTAEWSAYEYDLDGNLNRLRRANGPSVLDDIKYCYQLDLDNIHKLNNRLLYVDNNISVPLSVPDQMANNYDYDNIGNLRKDVEGQIDDIEWTPTGKVQKVLRSGGQLPDLYFSYDAMGNRIAKMEKPYNAVGAEDYIITLYSRDAQGNIMAIYDVQLNASGEAVDATLTDLEIYGSSRIGSIDATSEPSDRQVRSAKRFELTNHLGNVLAVISNEKIPKIVAPNTNISYFSPNVLSHIDYWPFGYPLAGRTSNPDEYRFGFNGQEKDDEVTGQTGSLFSAQFWEYDSRIGRRWNLDPKPNPSISFYATFADNPVRFCDVLGDSVRTKISRSLRRELGLTRKEAKNYTPSKISKVFEQEYGMNVEVRNGWLRYTGESKFQPESYSSTAKEMWRKELSDNYKSKDKIVLTNKGYEHNFAYKTSYINLSNFANDLTNVSVNYSDPDNVNLKRAYNLGRSFEHEFLGHGVMKLKDFTTAMSYEDVDGYEEFILGKQTALKLVNSFISEMGLQDYQRLFYGIYFQGGHMIFFGNPSKPFTPIHVITY